MPEKLILTLNAAEKRMQFLLSNEQKLIYAEDFSPKKGGTELLIPAISKAFQKIDLTYQDITHIACVIGPGNFMGIRLTAVTVAGLIRSLPNASQCLQAPLDYLQCIASNIPARTGETVRVITSATKNSVHCCDYTFDTHGIPQAHCPISLISIPTSIPISIPTSIPISIPALASSQAMYDNSQEVTKTNTNANANANAAITTKTTYPEYLMGSGLTAHKEYFQNTYPNSVHFVSETFDNPSIDALYRMTTQANWQKGDITPIYLKECDALQNLGSIAVKQGRNPQDAHTELERLMNSHTV